MIPSPGDQIALTIGDTTVIATVTRVHLGSPEQRIHRDARTGRFTTDQDVAERPGETTTEQR